jgi:chromosome segregation ATPase
VPDRNVTPGTAPRRTAAGGDPVLEIQNRFKTLQDDLRATREKLERETAEKQELARKYEQAIKATEESARKQVIAEGRAHRAEEALVKAEGDGVKTADELKGLRAEAEAARKAVRDIQIDRRQAMPSCGARCRIELPSYTKRIDSLGQDRDAARKKPRTCQKTRRDAKATLTRRRRKMAI